MQKRHTDRRQYFNEQAYTTLHHVIPPLEQFSPLVPGMRILEIGCGEGGNLKPFLDRGCLVTGIDLAANKIELARTWFSDHPARANLELIAGDIYTFPPPEHKFDVILMRDVIEHIHNQEKFMVFVRQFMHAKSIFFLAFPPWQNPFGGHQQICRNKVAAFMPYFHLLPAPLYPSILRWAGERKETIENLLEVKDTGLSAERFEKCIRASSYRVLKRQFFLINPNYEIKFGLKPIHQCPLISRIPGLRNYLSTSACYILVPE